MYTLPSSPESPPVYINEFSVLLPPTYSHSLNAASLRDKDIPALVEVVTTVFGLQVWSCSLFLVLVGGKVP